MSELASIVATTNQVSVLLVMDKGPVKLAVPLKYIPFDADTYLGVPLTLLVFLPFPDLSFHCVTFEPDNVIVDESDASSHNAKLGVVTGEKGVVVLRTRFSEFIFDIELPDISTF